MSLSPRLRKLALTSHVAASVGWLGAVAGFIALSIVGMSSQDEQTVRAAYVAMESVGWYVLVPLSLASLVTGLIQSLGTPWGLFRHYWIVFKLVINVVASFVLVLYMQTLDYFAGLAADTTTPIDDLRSPSPVVHAALAVVLLLVATVLSVYKPRGLTGYGRRKQHERRARSAQQQELQLDGA